MIKIIKRNSLAVLVALVICSAMMTAGCSVTEEAAMANNAENAAVTPGVYAEIKQYDKTIEITPVPGGITDSTVLPTFSCTFGDMTDEAQ